MKWNEGLRGLNKGYKKDNYFWKNQQAVDPHARPALVGRGLFGLQPIIKIIYKNSYFC